MISLLLHATSGGLYYFIKNELIDVKGAQSHFLGISESTFTNNSAKLTGGAIFTNSPNALGVCFNCSTLRVVSTPSFEEPLKRVIDIKKAFTKGLSDSINAFDVHWIRNVAEEQKGGGNVATTATSMRLCNVETDECVDGNGLTIFLNHTSGEDLQEINITLLDVFNKPALGQPRMRLEIKTNMTDVSLAGQMSVDFGHVAYLTKVQVQGPVNSQRNLTLSFAPDILSNINIEVELRGCVAGETEDRDHRGCTPCGPNLYSFCPNKNCTPCPENAKCSPSTITPEVGFWHVTSKSARVHECIVDDACNWINRTRDLEEAAMEAHRNEEVLLYNSASYKQCAHVSVKLTWKYCLV